jgi:two-component system, NtrC family, sensor kinase
VKLSWKINLALISLLVVSLGIQARMRLDRELALFEREMRQDQHVMGRSLRHAVEDEWQDSGPDAALAMVERLDAREEGVRIRYVEHGAAGARAPELESALPLLQPGGDLSRIEPDERDGPGWMYTYVHLDLPGAEAAAPMLEIRESLAAQRAYVRATSLRIAEWLGVTLAGTTVVVMLLMRWLVGRPVAALAAHARRVGAGDFGSRVGFDTGDELGQLARELDQMAGGLAAAQQALRIEQQAREEAIEQLRHADRLASVGRLAAGIAHELGTPLNVAMARAQMIEAWEVDDEADARVNASSIAEQCGRMVVIIRQLLDFARPRRLEVGTEDLRAIASDALELVAPLGRRRGVSLTLADGPPVFARVDRGQVQQVLLNLLSNAIAASPPGGTVTASVAGAERDGARIAVHDQGSVAAEHLPRVFEPFFTTKDVGEGTGLGLSVSHGIVREHGGSIEVRSPPGAGTTFEVHLPPGG